MLNLHKPEPRITVIVPCFNGQDFLGECLESVLSQKGVEFEVIVIDDGSDRPDEISAICEEVGDRRLRLIRKENGGVSSALNFALSESKTEVFCWLSHDDLMTPNRLASQFKKWEASGQQDKLLFGDYEVFAHSSMNSIGGRTRIGNYKHSIDLLSLGLINGCTVMASRAQVLAIGGFDEKQKTTQDYDLWLRLESSGTQFIYQPYVMCKSRQHKNQGSKNLVERQLENQLLWTRVASRLSEVYKQYGSAGRNRRLIDLSRFLKSSIYHRGLDMTPVQEHIENLMGGQPGHSKRHAENLKSSSRRPWVAWLWRVYTNLPYTRTIHTCAMKHRVSRRAIYFLQSLVGGSN